MQWRFVGWQHFGELLRSLDGERPERGLIRSFIRNHEDDPTQYRPAVMDSPGFQNYARSAGSTEARSPRNNLAQSISNELD